MATPYSDRYYQQMEPGSTRSAQAGPTILRLFPSNTVLDVGCGVGAWLCVYANAGCQIFGVDSDRVPTHRLLIAVDRFLATDLEQPLRQEARYDLVTCLEVAEHLSPRRAPTLVADVCQTRRRRDLLRGDPRPGRNSSHQRAMPELLGRPVQESTLRAAGLYSAADLDELTVDWWYAQNTFAFVRATRVADFPVAIAETRALPMDLIHPRAFVRIAIPSEMTPRMLKKSLVRFHIFPPRLRTAFVEATEHLGVDPWRG